jgi:hypothetical protein
MENENIELKKDIELKTIEIKVNKFRYEDLQNIFRSYGCDVLVSSFINAYLEQLHKYLRDGDKSHCIYSLNSYKYFDVIVRNAEHKE